MSDIADLDIESDLVEQVAALSSTGAPAVICGNGSKLFYGESVTGHSIEVAAHSGIIDYDPAELVITLKAGCRLQQVNELLAENGQMFGFEAPGFAPDATLGGVLAAGLAGPRRAYAGAIRDFVLGIKMINGRAEVQQFGGRVIKNVAGFDLSRLLVGSLGTLGIILEASIKVIPLPEYELTLEFEHVDPDSHIAWVNRMAGKPYPISASCWVDGRSLLRLSGSEQGVNEIRQQLGGELADFDWQTVAEQTHDFFNGDAALTRISLPPTTCGQFADQVQLIEWGGAQRWLCGEVDLEALRQQVEPAGGLVTAFRNHADGIACFHPPGPAVFALQRRIKSSFDPAGILNPGRIYPGL